ncbi:MAG: esterase/lipase family protein [Acidimicrobiia bacterium]
MDLFAFDIDELSSAVPVGRDAAASVRAQAVTMRSRTPGRPDLAGSLVALAEQVDHHVASIEKRVVRARGIDGTLRKLDLPMVLGYEAVFHPGRIKRRAGRALKNFSNPLTLGFKLIDPGFSLRVWKDLTGQDFGYWSNGPDVVTWRQIRWAFAHLARAAGHALWRLGPFYTPPASLEDFHGTGNLVVAMGGMGSSMDLDPKQPKGTDQQVPEIKYPVDFNMNALGYPASDVHYASYSDDPNRYTSEDTFNSTVKEHAARLDVYLRKLHEQYPDRKVDLIGHSLGGAVEMYWLRTMYNPKDPGLPTIANYVSVNSPLSGAPLAQLDHNNESCPASGTVVRAGINAAYGDLPPRNAKVFTDIDRVGYDGELPSGVRMHFIGTRDDFVVPADTAAPPGRSAEIVNARGLTEDHSGTVNSEAGTKSILYFLANRPAPEQSFGEEARNAFHPLVIHSTEKTAAAGLGSLHC